ncbi:bifunctional DNase/RNase [Natronocella acetinitrilica]|jgi:uncharacterized protein|uniref:Bifunctional DNase/RNase n=1 Tax=Natronocella acetinitrilica TaxID=414046 RepID=A0AAE3G583_9GAMM|nr:bifunctional nuclease domain-containing protein [Natronocella acetinitrilica]MCP1676120.1 bifunctional DNase/RNase [Natronocella acetinitrilica]
MAARFPRIPLILALIAPLLAAATFGAHARELAVHPDELVPVELATVGFDRLSGAPVVLLREPESGDVVPILVGVNEARAILMALHDVSVRRPMTHDLMHSLVGAIDARLERVMVDELRDGTYFGMLQLRKNASDETIMVDTRPSDGLALALRAGAMILVAPAILQHRPDLEFEGLQDDEVVTALDITVVPVTAELREALGLPEDAEGVLVSRARGRAASAGISEGDLILSINGEVPRSPMDFLELVGETSTGARARIRYWDGNEEQEVELPTDVPMPRAEDGPRISL